MGDPVTGIVDQYLALSEEADADVVAMQVGDFYEFFADGARLVSDELDLKVSEKSSHGSSYPMAGVPVADLTPYLKALVERGYRVAVADQREDGEEITRAVTRVVTPGTLLDATDAAARYLAAVVRADGEWGLAFADVTTGQFHVVAVDDAEAALSECYRFDPVEVLPGPAVRDDESLRRRVGEQGAEVTDHDPEAFAPGAAAHAVREQFGAGAVDSLGLDARGAAVRAAGAVLAYVEATGAGVLASLTRLQPLATETGVALDATTQRNLELTETMSGGGGSLSDVLDHTATSAGGRLLREWLVRPTRDVEELERRQGCVGALAGSALARERIRETLGGVYDLERLAGRAAAGRADPTELVRVRETLARLPDLREAVANAPGLAESPVADLLPAEEELAALRRELADALVDDPPASPGEGVFRRGYDAAVEEVAGEYEEVREWLDGLAARERERLGVTHLQVDRNRTDGYYIQVGNSETDVVPDSYREVKTLKNSKRYTTDALDERERAVLRLEERRAEVERRLFDDLRERVGAAADALQRAGRALARLDVVGSLAVHAVENGWTRPTLATDGRLAVEAGRHPVVEQTTEFVPNDVYMDGERRFLLVTGPNMSGKSTYMRQVALLTLLAQVGSFLPADDAEVGLVDGIYTRVGALDELAQGRSTFMVEMQELSNILHAATEESLVILDEVGRGTATYDGISIAWAATEYLLNATRSKTLFATHYHELAALADNHGAVENVHLAADEREGDVTFLRTVREGPANRSYGVHVAELAGVPDPVVERSREVLARLRDEQSITVRGGEGDRDAGGTTQVVFDLGTGQFTGASDDGGADAGGEAPARPDGREATDEEGTPDPVAASVLEELRDTDVNDTTPVEVLSKLQEWQARLGEGRD